jgi:hypothetical protein
MIVINVKMAASRHLDFARIPTEAKHLKLCTGMPYCYISGPARRHGTMFSIVMNESACCQATFGLLLRTPEVNILCHRKISAPNIMFSEMGNTMLIKAKIDHVTQVC